MSIISSLDDLRIKWLVVVPSSARQRAYILIRPLGRYSFNTGPFDDIFLTVSRNLMTAVVSL